jgi:magnesium chelatase family protein
MLATLITAVVDGLAGALVRVEVDVAPGLPSCQIVGLPDTALSEARERVRAAVRNAGFTYPPRRITVNLAPADRRKRGAAYDLAIAVGILVASDQLRIKGDPVALLGELSLDGSLQAVPGVLPMVATLVRAGYERVGLPRANLGEARLVAGADAIGLDHLAEAALLLADRSGGRRALARHVAPRGSGLTVPSSRVVGPDSPTTIESRNLVDEIEPVDLADVRGQATARWALEIALAGGHNLLLVGPPGAGKTLIARAIPGLLPPLDDAEALEVTVIESVAGLVGPRPTLRRARPFRAPHHTSSYVAMVGGGPRLAPGLVSLAHRGVLFLDELAEFDRNVLDALRQPLEEGRIHLARAGGQVTYPARLQLVAAMNPCRCGFAGDPERVCRCRPNEPERYMRRVSGPLLDRLDLRVELRRVTSTELLASRPTEPSAVVAARIAAGRAAALARNGGLSNAELGGGALVRLAGMGPSARHRLAELADAGRLSARATHRLVRVARTIADLEGSVQIGEETILAAAALRGGEAGALGLLVA